MSAQENACPIRFQCTEIYSNVVVDPFVVFFLSVPTVPRSLTLMEASEETWSEFGSASMSDELAFVGQMYCSRLNDDGNKVSQYLGSFVVDLSTVHKQEYTFVVRDSSSKHPLRTGQIVMKFEMPDNLKLNPLRVQDQQFARQMYTAADANLTLIHGFSPRGLPGIVSGLHYVHSPYYVNHLGVTLPAGAFCMIPTSLEDDKTKAVRSHRQRFMVALARNCMSPADWMAGIQDMMNNSLKSRHLRCLSVVADTVTLHARLDMYYTPDVQLLPESKGTERWSVPREPDSKGGISFTGDCEDFAREVYQQCKEIRDWIKPGEDSLMSHLSSVLHMYVPTIEQGAVDSEAHSKYITYDAAYRNHIWAALHPRNAWRTKIHGLTRPIKDALYKDFPEQKCERTLPLLHLEGTGDVYPVVTCRKPGYIAKMVARTEDIQKNWPFVIGTTTPDMSLQCDHKSNFYKYAIAFMTDIFKDHGLLDYTYVTDRTYGVSIYDWARGKYNFRPSTQHSPEIMENIDHMIRLERPILPITTESQVIKKHKGSGYYLRFGSTSAIDDEYSMQGEYQVGSHKWYEVYFKVDDSKGSSSEIDVK